MVGEYERRLEQQAESEVVYGEAKKAEMVKPRREEQRTMGYRSSVSESSNITAYEDSEQWNT